MKKKVTTTDIAKMAGVSQATVSMILNKKYNVSFSRETIEKVEKAAEELGYHKSECRRARKLTGQKLIAVFCPTLTNPYYVMLLQGIEEIAKESGYTVFVCNTLRDLKTEESCLRMLRQIQPMGIIYTCNPSACFRQEILALSENIPLVVIKTEISIWKWMWWSSTTRSRDGSWPGIFWSWGTGKWGSFPLRLRDGSSSAFSGWRASWRSFGRPGFRKASS